MKLREIAEKLLINRKDDFETLIDLENIAEDLDIHIYNYKSIKDNIRLKSIFFAPYYSEDSIVGARMYFLDDEPICYSLQIDSKSDERFIWFGHDNANKVKEYIKSLLIEKGLYIETVNLDMKIDGTYKASFNDEIVDWDYALYNNKPFKLIERIEEELIPSISHKIKIEQDGKEFIVNVGDIDLKYWIGKEK